VKGVFQASGFPSIPATGARRGVSGINTYNGSGVGEYKTLAAQKKVQAPILGEQGGFEVAGERILNLF